MKDIQSDQPSGQSKLNNSKHKANVSLPCLPESTQMAINEQTTSSQDKLNNVVSNTDQAVLALEACVQQYRECDKCVEEFAGWLDEMSRHMEEALVPQGTLAEKQDQAQQVKVGIYFIETLSGLEFPTMSHILGYLSMQIAQVAPISLELGQACFVSN